MWKATTHRKVENLLGRHSADGPAAWRAIADTTEDLLTSTVVERLTYLPGTLATLILLRAAEPQHLRFVPTPGALIESLPWPNVREAGPKLEPDWVLATGEYTLIVEAKWGRGVVPSHAQLLGQREAVLEQRTGRLVHLVLIQSGRFRAPPQCPCLVVRWSDLRHSVLRSLRDANEPGTRRILGDIRDALDRRGLDRVFLRSLRGEQVEGTFSPWRARPDPVRELPPLSPLRIADEARIEPWT